MSGSRLPASRRLDLAQGPLTGTQWIEASAGTGKTWAICALVLRLLLERGLALPQILVVTFTNAAAAELRERIRSRLSEALAAATGRAPGDAFVQGLLERLAAKGQPRDEVAQQLEQALQSFDEAAIRTIHGHAMRALSDTPMATGMPLATLALQDNAPLQLEVARDAWRRGVLTPHLGADVAQWLLNQGDAPEQWADLLKRRVARPQAELRWPAALMSSASVSADPASEVDTEAPAQAHASAHAEARTIWLSRREEVVQMLQATQPTLAQNIYKPESLQEAIEMWDEWLANATPSMQTLRVQRKDSRASLLTHARFKAKKGEPAVPRHDFIDAATVWWDTQLAWQQAAQLARLKLVQRMLATSPAALQALKRERRITTHDDALARLAERLAPGQAGQAGERLAASLRQRHPVALIDEFQDTDPLQWSIVQAVYQPHREGSGAERPHDEAAQAPAVFLVGDPKQAIYAFRDADLPTYLAARATADAVSTLADNQRASGPMLAALNALFTQHTGVFAIEGLAYQPVQLGAKPRAAWQDASEAPADRKAALQLWQLPSGSDGLPPAKGVAKRLAAKACAGDIARLLREGQASRVLHDGRGLTGGDIAVLVRSHHEGRLMREALQAVGVASVELSQRSVFDSIDAAELLTLLSAVAEPTHGSQLRSALATSLMGWDATRIEALVAASRRSPDVRDSDAGEADDPVWAELTDRFLGWRQLWRDRGVAVLLRRLLPTEGVWARLLPMADGERRLTNLGHLAELLHQAEVAQASPERLLAWLTTQCQEPARRGDREASQLRLESDRHLVQVVTIHASKGLEYPVVFLPFAWNPGDRREPSGRLGVDHREGERSVIDLRVEVEGEEAEAVKQQAKEALAADRFAENLRLLYVALTRAVHRCVVVMGLSSGPKGSLKGSVRNPLNWIVAGGATHGGDVAAWLAMETNKQQALVDGVMAQWPVVVERALAEQAQALGEGASPSAGIAGTPGAPGGHTTGALTVAAASLTPLPTGPWLPLTAERPALSELSLATLPAHIEPARQIASFTSLMRHVSRASQEAVGVDHDANDDEQHEPLDDAVVDVPVPREDDILNFPRGADAGVCLHAVFEHADFTQPSTWPSAVARALREHSPGAAGSEDAAAQWPAMLLRMLRQVLETPLPIGGRLCEVPPAKRLNEWPFHLPMTSLSTPVLLDLMAQHGWADGLATPQRPDAAAPASVALPTGLASASSLNGHLHGVVDLVLEHQGRWHLLDWKSNHLGPRPQDYGPASLRRAMQAHGYGVQALLYAVAVHRLLQDRLPGYDFDAHFGGVHYLFVRGVRGVSGTQSDAPGWQAADGSPLGVYTLKPPRALVELLCDRYFAPRAAMHASLSDATQASTEAWS